MATRVEAQMSFEDRTLFLPDMTIKAMRDSRYRHPALAVAELIDNSIDARANRVEVLIREHNVRVNQRNRWRVAELALLDNGHGMSAETLVQALRFGGRRAAGSVQQIGKYGMGLPTSSVSQCKRVDVWTWEDGIDNSSHSYIDIDEIEAGGRHQVPEPDASSIPEQWLDMMSSETFDPNHGTLVVWSKPDRIIAQSQTIFDQLEQHIGRLYRHYIDQGEPVVRMACYRSGHQKPRLDSTVRPNDPLYLTSNSATPPPWNVEPMFKPYSAKEFILDVDGREESVQVNYSIVRQEALGERKGDLPGNRDYGVHARKNMGISVVREGREIVLEHFFNTEGGGGSLPQNRWWGCEVLFGSGCDDVFGVDHNKQMVSYFARAVTDTATGEGEGEGRQQRLDELGVGVNDVYQIVDHVRSTVKAMMREIERMFAARPGTSPGNVAEGAGSPEQEAISIVTEAVRESIKEAGSQPTPTDLDRQHMDEHERTARVATLLVQSGMPVLEAQAEATRIVKNDDWFNINPAQLPGDQMFNFVSSGGVLNMNLNIYHPVYRFIDLIETEADASGNDVARRAAVGILAMLLSWGRMEDDIHDADIRRQVQTRALRWGEFVSRVLKELEPNYPETG